jgi:hypothetical protein
MDGSPLESWKDGYANPDRLVEIEFSTKTNQPKYVWVEPAAISIELDLNTEYKIVTHEKAFAIEYNSEHQFTLWMERSFGFKLYKRPLTKINASSSWQLDMDLSDIN